jgi:DNA-binding NtrC family response regulator
MKAAQVLVMEPDGKLSAILEGLVVEQKRCLLRHPRHAKECLEWLDANDTAVLVLPLGEDPEASLTLLASVARRYPNVAVVVVAEPIQGNLVGAAWDLGAAYVLVLPQPRELVREVVAGLMTP